MEEENKQQFHFDILQQQWNMFQSIQIAKTMLFQKEERESFPLEEQAIRNHYNKSFPAPIGIQVDVNV